jgi:lipopolysaccharide export system permease protein
MMKATSGAQALIKSHHAAIALERVPSYTGVMRQYERYLLAHLLWPTVLVTVALTGIVWLTQVLRFIDFMLNRGLTLGDFLFLTGLMLPSLLLIILPVALCIAVIFTYNRLTADSELIVLHAVGVSKIGLARPVMIMGAGCTIVCYALALYLMPIANRHFQDIRTFFRDKYASVLLEEEVFNNPITGITVFVQSRDARNTLHGVLLHDNRNADAPITMIADRGYLEQTATGPRFYLEQGMRQQYKNGAVSWLTFDNYAIDIAFFAADRVRKPDPDERTIMELFDDEGMSAQESAALRAEAHHRLTWPALAFALPLLALAFLFSGEFNRRGQWRRITAASVAMVATVLLFFAFRSIIVKQPWLAALMYISVFVPTACAYYVLATGRPLRLSPRRVLAIPEGVHP